MNHIGENIKIRLNKLNMSQIELSEKTGIATVTLSRLVNGKQQPHTDNLEAIAKALKCKPEDLYRAPIDGDEIISYIKELIEENRRLREQLSKKR